MPIKLEVQRIGHGQDHVAIRHAFIERPPDVGHPLIHVHLAAGEAEAALTAERHPFLFQAVRAQVRRIARLQGATAEHFVDHGLHVVILGARMALLEGPPVITEDLLEGVFVDPLFVGCHGRWLYHTLPPGSTCLSSLPCAPPWSLERGEQGQQKRKFLYAKFMRHSYNRGYRYRLTNPPKALLKARLDNIAIVP